MAKNNQSDLFGESVATNSNDFAALFEQSLKQTDKNIKVGDSFKAEILSIGKDESFVSTGTPRDAVMLTVDLYDENKQVKYKVSDVIEVVVTRVSGDEIRVSRKGAKGAPADVESLEDAFDMELPVEGKVTEVVNGGFRVQINQQNAFCPFSQMDSKPVQEHSAFLGKKFEFVITQLDPKKRNIVVSRRKLLDLQKAEDEGAWLQQHKVGDLLNGTVTRTESYGALVSLGSQVEGLVHISEIAFHRIKHSSELLKPGDTVQVKILRVEEEDQRLKISLSIKQAGGIGDPWMQVPQKYPVGKIHEGTVDKRENFGLFIVLEPGINGLLPKSKWRDSTEAKTFENLKKGDTIKVRIDEIKFEERKISLGLPTEAEDDSWREHNDKNNFGSMAQLFSKIKIK